MRIVPPLSSVLAIIAHRITLGVVFGLFIMFFVVGLFAAPDSESRLGTAIFLLGILTIISLSTALHSRAVGKIEAGYSVASLAKAAAADNLAVMQIARRFPHLQWSLSPGAMEPANLQILLEILDEIQPRKIIELGPGISTLITAAFLAESGAGHIVSFEHSDDWVKLCNRSLARNHLTPYATVRHVPLVPMVAFKEEVCWYDLSASAEVFDGIELLIVDGPPAVTNPLTRLPALSFFIRKLAPNSIILLDDGHRSGEQAIVKVWRSVFPQLAVEFRPTASGLWLLRCGGVDCSNACVAGVS